MSNISRRVKALEERGGNGEHYIYWESLDEDTAGLFRHEGEYYTEEEIDARHGPDDIVFLVVYDR